MGTAPDLSLAVDELQSTPKVSSNSNAIRTHVLAHSRRGQPRCIATGHGTSTGCHHGTVYQGSANGHRSVRRLVASRERNALFSRHTLQPTGAYWPTASLERAHVAFAFFLSAALRTANIMLMRARSTSQSGAMLMSCLGQSRGAHQHEHLGGRRAGKVPPDSRYATHPRNSVRTVIRE